MVIPTVADAGKENNNQLSKRRRCENLKGRKRDDCGYFVHCMFLSECGRNDAWWVVGVCWLSGRTKKCTACDGDVMTNFGS